MAEGREAICLPFQMDFLVFREQETAHLLIRSPAEIAASRSLAPHSAGPLCHAAPVSRQPQRPGPHKWEPSGGLPPPWKLPEGGGGGGSPPLPLLSSSLCFLSRHLALLTVMSLLWFLQTLSPTCTCVHGCPQHLHTRVHTYAPLPTGCFQTLLGSSAGLRPEGRVLKAGPGFHFPFRSGLPSCPPVPLVIQFP